MVPRKAVRARAQPEGVLGGASVHKGSPEGRQLLRAFLWVMHSAKPRAFSSSEHWAASLSGFWTILLTTSDLVGVTLEPCTSLLFAALIF